MTMKSFNASVCMMNADARYASRFVLGALRKIHKGEGRAMQTLYIETMLRGMCADPLHRTYVEAYFNDYFSGGAEKAEDESDEKFAERLAAERSYVERIMKETQK